MTPKVWRRMRCKLWYSTHDARPFMSIPQRLFVPRELKPRRQIRGCSRPVAELKNGQSPHPAAASDDKDLKMSWPEVVEWKTRAGVQRRPRSPATGPTCRLACRVRPPCCRRTTTPTASSSSSTPAASSSGLPSSASWSPPAYYSVWWMVCYRFHSIMCFYVYWTPRIK
jgi:hypothetical protein